MAVIVIGDSLTFHGPRRAEPLDDPRLWPNVLSAAVGRPVEVFAREGWTAREAWWALTKEPRLWPLLPGADAVVFAVGAMDQLPVALPTYLRLGMSYLPTERTRGAARQAFVSANPRVVRLTGGPFRTLPQRATDEYLTRCVRSLRSLRPELPLVGIVPQDWVSPYYPSNRRHADAAAAARRWGKANDVAMVDWEAMVAPYGLAGLNPDGMHWGWEVHAAAGAATALVLAALLGDAQSA